MLLKLSRGSHTAGRRAAPCFFHTLLNPRTTDAVKPRGIALLIAPFLANKGVVLWAPSPTKPVPCRFTSNWGGLCYTMTCKLPTRCSQGWDMPQEPPHCSPESKTIHALSHRPRTVFHQSCSTLLLYFEDHQVVNHSQDACSTSCRILGPPRSPFLFSVFF